MGFDEVIGQKEAAERLQQLVREERLPHALMLCGPQGCGKLPLAVAFACYLLDNGTPSAKAMLAKLEHPDLHFTYINIAIFPLELSNSFNIIFNKRSFIFNSIS